MANGLDRRNNGLLVGVLIGAAVVALAVLAYFYYQRSREPVVKIDVPRSAKTGRRPSNLTLRRPRNAGAPRHEGQSLWNEHRGAGELALAQAGKRLIGGGDRHLHHRCPYPGLRRERQELARIRPREVGDGT